MQRSIDADGLMRARRWGNIANGALLFATGPVALVVSTFGLKLSNIVISLYVTAFGGLLAGIELGLAPIAPWVTQNLSYLTTASGRTALLAFMGGLTWPLGRMGLVPALLTAMNALFNANFNQLLAFVSEDDSREEAPVDSTFDPEPVAGEAGEDTAEAAAEAAAAAAAVEHAQAQAKAAQAQAQQRARTAQMEAAAEEAEAQRRAAEREAAEAAAAETAAAQATAKAQDSPARGGSGADESGDDAQMTAMREALEAARSHLPTES